MTRSAAALLPLLLPLLTSAQEAGGAERVLQLTLEDALRIAVERNLELELEMLNSEIASYDYLGSWGAFDPVFTLTGRLSDSEIEGSSSLSGADVVDVDSQGLNTTLGVPFTTGGRLDLSYDRDNTRTNNQFAVFDTSTTDVVSIALTQPLLRGAWSRFATADQRESEVSLRQQEATYEEVRQRVLRDVTNAYWDLVGAVEELGVRELALETGERQLAQDRRRLEVGVGTEVDVLQSETNRAQLEEQRLLAEFNLRAAEDALRTLLFQRSDGEVQVDFESWDWPIVALTPLPAVDETIELDWLRSLDLAIRNRPELERQRLEIEASEVRLVRAESTRLPGLDLTLSATSTGFDDDPSAALNSATGFDFPTYTGSLAFDVPIRNRTAKFAERAARAALRAARVGYDQVELTVLAEVRSAVRGVAYSVEGVRAATTSRDFAERQVAAEQARYDEGLSTTFQVLEFQRDLAEALSTLTTARAAYAKALTALEHAEGRVSVPAGE